MNGTIASKPISSAPHPLTDVERIDRYWRQNGHQNGLTPRQRRRTEHKACRAFYRSSATEDGAK